MLIQTVLIFIVAGSNYENSSIPAEGFADRNQHYRKNEGWDEGTRESSHRPNPPNGDTDDFFNLPSRQKCKYNKG